jgi:phosphoribosylformimino-5-aminoimidazole carboxamide ribonucleotide (ProFAR) isomerase
MLLFCFPSTSSGIHAPPLTRRITGISPEGARHPPVARVRARPRLTAGTPTARATAERVTRFRPCIDIHNGKVKQIVGSSLSADGSRASVVNFEATQPAAYYVTSYVFRDGRLDESRLLRLAHRIGRERLVLDLSCRSHISGSESAYYVYTDRWTRRTDLRISGQLLEWLSEYCAEFLVHAVDVEGKQTGIDEALVHELAVGSPVPATYAGGVRDLADLERVRLVGCGRVDVTIGSALDIFGGALSFDMVVEWQRRLEKMLAR